MTDILTTGEQVEVVLRDIIRLIGVNNLPAPHLLSLIDEGETVLVTVLLHDLAGLRRWAAAADVTIDSSLGWHRAETRMSGVRVKFSAYEKGVRA